MTGCGWKVTPPKFRDNFESPGLIADSVVLTVNEGAVIWGHGDLGELLREKLLAEGAFRQVHYPIEPRNPPPYRLTINAKGSIDEEIGFGIVKSIFIGLLFFIPVGIIRFNRDFILDADISFQDDGAARRRFKITSETTVSHTMFSHGEQYEPVARKAAAEDLGLRIIRELSHIQQ